jgi:ribosomal protein S18 acetylase RimI-like enzyme
MADPRGERAAAVTLRPALPDDRERCAAIAVAAWTPISTHRRATLGESLFDRLHPRWAARKAGEIGAAFEHHIDWIVVATPTAPGQEAPDVVAFVTYRLDPQRRVGTIGSNAVDPGWQGRGIATTLYRHVLDLFRAAGMEVAAVTTELDEAHAPARGGGRGRAAAAGALRRGRTTPQCGATPGPV